MDEKPCPYKDEQDCDKMIPDSWRMETYEGFVVWKDEHNTIRHRHNLPNFGKMVAKRVKNLPPKVDRVVIPDSDLADAMVDALRNPGDEDASLEAQIQLIRALAPVIEQGGAGATSAATTVGNMIGEIFKQMRPPGPNEKCKLCGREEKPPIIKISRELAESEFEE